MATEWHPNTGHRPDTGEKPLRVQWADGTTSKYTYSAKQLDWRIKDKILAIAFWKEEN